MMNLEVIIVIINFIIIIITVIKYKQIKMRKSNSISITKKNKSKTNKSEVLNPTKTINEKKSNNSNSNQFFNQIENFYKKLNSITLKEIYCNQQQYDQMSSHNWFTLQQKNIQILTQKLHSKYVNQKVYQYYKAKLQSAITILTNIKQNYQKSRQSQIPLIPKTQKWQQNQSQQLKSKILKDVPKVDNNNYYGKTIQKKQQLASGSIQKLKQTLFLKQKLLSTNYHKQFIKNQDLQYQLQRKQIQLQIRDQRIKKIEQQLFKFKQHFNQKNQQKNLNQSSKQNIGSYKKSILKDNQERSQNKLSLTMKDRQLINKNCVKQQSNVYTDNTVILKIISQYQQQIFQLKCQNNILRQKYEQSLKKIQLQMQKNIQQDDLIRSLQDKVVTERQQYNYLQHKQQSQLQKSLNNQKQLIQELLYEKQNYRDGYQRLKQINEGLEQKIKNIQDSVVQQKNRIIQDLNKQIKSLKNKMNQYQKKQQENKKDLNYKDKQIDQFNFVVKQLKLQIRQQKIQNKNLTQKCQIYIEKYYQLKQNKNLTQSSYNNNHYHQKTQLSTQRIIPKKQHIISRNNQQLNTLNTQQRSVQKCLYSYHQCQQQTQIQQNKKLKVLADLKDLVKTHKLHISTLR